MAISGGILHVQIDLEHIISLFADDIIIILFIYVCFEDIFSNTCTYSQFICHPKVVPL